MPIQNCQVDRKPGYRYGQSGKCYIYKEGDKASQTRARNKARKQGIAQIINSFEFSLAKQRVSFDYDETLSTDKGKALAKERISSGGRLITDVKGTLLRTVNWYKTNPDYFAYF